MWKGFGGGEHKRACRIEKLAGICAPALAIISKRMSE